MSQVAYARSQARSQTMPILIGASVMLSLAMGMRQSFGLFVGPLTRDIGVTAGEFTFAIAVQNIVWGVTQPFVGALADKHGPRPILITTALLYASGMLLMVFSHGELGLDIAGFLLGVGTAGTAFGVLIGVVTRATPEAKRSQTVGLVAASGSLGTMVLAPLAWFVEDLRITFAWPLFAAIIFLVICASILAVSALHTLMRHGEATRVTSLFYLTPVFAVVLEFALFKVVPSIVSILGIAITCAGVALVAWKRDQPAPE